MKKQEFLVRHPELAREIFMDGKVSAHEGGTDWEQYKARQQNKAIMDNTSPSVEEYSWTAERWSAEKDYPAERRSPESVKERPVSIRQMVKDLHNAVVTKEPVQEPKQERNTEWEILEISYSNRDGNGIVSFGNQPAVLKNARVLDELKKIENSSIYSVKRLSDNEVFTIGDEIKDFYTKGSCKISEFQISGETMNAVSVIDGERFSASLLYVKKVKPKPLFTTEDGVAIYSGDRCWTVLNYKSSYGWDPLEVKVTTSVIPDGKFFSTKEAAKEYVNANKPVFSFNDIVSALQRDGYDKPYSALAFLKTLAKQRCK